MPSSLLAVGKFDNLGSISCCFVAGQRLEGQTAECRTLATMYGVKLCSLRPAQCFGTIWNVEPSASKKKRVVNQYPTTYFYHDYHVWEGQFSRLIEVFLFSDHLPLNKKLKLISTAQTYWRLPSAIVIERSLWTHFPSGHAQKMLQRRSYQNIAKPLVSNISIVLTRKVSSYQPHEEYQDPQMPAFLEWF